MDSNTSNKNFLTGAIVFVILALGAWCILGGHFSGTGTNASSTTTLTSTATSTATSTSTLSGGGVSIQGIKGATIKEVPVADTGIKAPNLDRTPKVTVTLTAEQKSADLSKIAQLTSAIKKDPNYLGNWISLGTYYEAIGDYASAEEIWTYASKAWTGNAVAYNNLGNLYRYDLKDYTKSEQSFLAAVKTDPSFIDGYQALYELYIGSYSQKKEQVPVILKEGIKNNPSNLQLPITLAEYYQKQGDITQARSYFTKALTIAQTANNTDAAQAIQKELDAL